MGANKTASANAALTTIQKKVLSPGLSRNVSVVEKSRLKPGLITIFVISEGRPVLSTGFSQAEAGTQKLFPLYQRSPSSESWL
jgi:hypothetical protein